MHYSTTIFCPFGYQRGAKLPEEFPHSFRFEITFPPDHPVFAGHFPEEPVVPGALLLARVAAGIQASGQYAVAGVSSARFTQRIKPGQTVVVDCRISDSGNARFQCTVTGHMVARGVFDVTAG